MLMSLGLATDTGDAKANRSDVKVRHPQKISWNSSSSSNDGSVMMVIATMKAKRTPISRQKGNLLHVKLQFRLSRLSTNMKLLIINDLRGVQNNIFSAIKRFL